MKYLLLILFLAGCGDSFERKPIDATRMGVNNFFIYEDVNGSRPSQAAEITDSIKLNYVRVLFAFNDITQRVGEFEDIVINDIPDNLRVMANIGHAPPEIQDFPNPRKAWIDLFFKPLVIKFANEDKIMGFQVWNEPNTNLFPWNNYLDVRTKPENYIELLQMAHDVMRQYAPNKLIIGAATTSLLQNHPETLNYNRDLVNLGIGDLIDIYSIHVYGDSTSRLFEAGDIINPLNKPIWVTESGERGSLNQLEFVERTWHVIRDAMPTTDLIFFYQMYDVVNEPGRTEGLRSNRNEGMELSDLYIYLRDR